MRDAERERLRVAWEKHQPTFDETIAFIDYHRSYVWTWRLIAAALLGANLLTLLRV